MSSARPGTAGTTAPRTATVARAAHKRRATLHGGPASQQATARRGGATTVPHRPVRTVRTGRGAGTVEGEAA